MARRGQTLVRLLPSVNPHLPRQLLQSRSTQKPLRLGSPLFRSHFSSSPSRLDSKPVPPASSPKSSTPRALLLQQVLEARKSLIRLETQLEQLRQKYAGQQLSRSTIVLLSLLTSILALYTTYNLSSTFRRIVIAGERSGRIGVAVVGCIWDYKVLFYKTDSLVPGCSERHDAYEDCHRRCAVRIREALKKNGGIFIKLGQHLSSIALIPVEWSSTMRPLQDQCFPTSLKGIQQLFLDDVGAPLTTFFSTFDPVPIGVASLAQVHIATERGTGRQCAVKVMHPDLEEFCHIDMKTTVWLLGVVKSVFPTFEFTWLGEEMEINLPLEMDFRHEAANAARCDHDFAELKSTTLVIPSVYWCSKRVLVMEYIVGSRLDDLEYLAKHSIDRNLVSQELSRIFSRMIYITGYFHADPHAGNALIRPARPSSRSPYNFEIVLLDHGLYFEMSQELRVNYAHLWLSLIAPSTPKIEADRRRYAYAAGNIDESLYPIFQAAITGRAALENAIGADGGSPKSMMDMGKQTREEEKMLRSAVVGADGGEGLLLTIFELLRRVPRRILMVLKVNDLTRALDASLRTTHGPARNFLIVAQHCNLAVYLEDLAQVPKISFSPLHLSTYSSLFHAFDIAGIYWRYQSWHISLSVAEWVSDRGAEATETALFFKGLWRKGSLQGARAVAAGLE